MAQHPLEPLSGDEFRQTASIMRREGLVRDTFRFASIELKEPPKSEVKAWRPGDAVRRASFAVVFNREDNKTYEATATRRRPRSCWASSHSRLAVIAAITPPIDRHFGQQHRYEFDTLSMWLAIAPSLPSEAINSMMPVACRPHS